MITLLLALQCLARSEQLPAKFEGGSIFIELATDREPIWALLDSGAQESRWLGPETSMRSHVKILNKSYSLGKMKVEASWKVTGPAKVELILGVDLMRDFGWIIDFEAEKLAVIHPTRVATEYEKFLRSSGSANVQEMDLVQQDGGFFLPDGTLEIAGEFLLDTGSNVLSAPLDTQIPILFQDRIETSRGLEKTNFGIFPSAISGTIIPTMLEIENALDSVPTIGLSVLTSKQAFLNFKSSKVAFRKNTKEESIAQQLSTALSLNLTFHSKRFWANFERKKAQWLGNQTFSVEKMLNSWVTVHGASEVIRSLREESLIQISPKVTLSHVANRLEIAPIDAPPRVAMKGRSWKYLPKVGWTEVKQR